MQFFSLQNIHNTVIASLARIKHFLFLQFFHIMSICQKSSCGTNKVAHTFFQNPFCCFCVLNTVACNDRHRSIFFHSSCQRCISPFGYIEGNLFHRGFMPTTCYCNGINESFLFRFSAKNNGICQFITAIQHLGSRNFYQNGIISNRFSHSLQNFQRIRHSFVFSHAIFVCSQIGDR